MRPRNVEKIMSDCNNNDENAELQERIKSIKNIGYFVYTWHRRIIICTAITAVVMMLAIAFLMEWHYTTIIALGAFFGVAVIIISIALLHIYYRKQYLIEYNGKTILVAGGFRRFRKYYVNNSCYKIKNGQAVKIKYKKIDSIKILFSEMKKAEILKTVRGNKEVFSIKQKIKEDSLTVALGGGGPVKYGEMTFIDGKFKSGNYASTSSMSYTLHFKILKDGIKCADIVPLIILNLLVK